MFLVLDHVQAVTHSRAAFAIADSVLAVGGQLTTVAALLMYLGTAQKRVTKAEAVTLESQRIVETMSVFARQITGKRELVAPRLAARFAGVLHHGAADSLPLTRGQHRHVLHNTGGRASLPSFSMICST